MSPIEYLSDQDGQGSVLRARYHVPALSEADDIDAIFSDMVYLCEHDALSLRKTMQPLPPRVIVSISEEPIAFGESNASVLQYFEAFRIEDNRCIWELF